MNTGYFINQFSQLIEMSGNESLLQLPLKNLQCWDSISVLSSIALIDECFHVPISGVEIETCETLNDIIQLIKRKQ